MEKPKDIAAKADKKSKKSKRTKEKGKNHHKSQTKTKSQLPPLVQASLDNNEEVIRRLVQDEGVPPTTRTQEGLTGLHVTSLASTVDLLVSFGAKVDAEDVEGRTPIRLAVLEDRLDAVRGLLVHHSLVDGPLVHLAVSKGAKMLSLVVGGLKDGSLVNFKGKGGKTPLHVAAGQKDAECLTVLLGCEALEPDLTDDNGQTALHVAIRKSEACAKALIEHGVKLNIKDKDGNTPLHLCAIEGIEALASLLIRKGAEVVVANNDQKTPMHLATEHEKDDVCYILQTNGADVSIRYQWKTPTKKKKLANDEEIVDLASHLNEFGFVEGEDKKQKLDMVDSKKQKREDKKLDLERVRARKWAQMIKDWDKWLVKRPKKIKSRVLKGLPDSLRCEAWKKLTQCEKLNDPVKYQELIKAPSKWAEQIDLDINRSFRNHVQFKDRYGPGQVALFNILKAYSVYDPEVGYCQGMSDMTAFILMYVTEEDAFWLIVKLLNEPKYNMHGIFLPGFPLLQRTFWIFEQLFKKECPKLQQHFAKENVMTMFFGTKWFMLIFLDAFPFSITVRLWDLFLYKGYDIVYTIAIGLFKLHEKKLLSFQFDQIMSFFKSLENIGVEADDFISFIMKHKVDSKTIRRYEEKYQERDPQASKQNSEVKLSEKGSDKKKK